MANRLNLQQLLESKLGSRNVYFQPPSTIKMQYPAIVYCLNDIVNRAADNIPYTRLRSWKVTLIDKNPDSIYIDKIAEIPSCSLDRYYSADNLNHYTFTLYY